MATQLRLYTINRGCLAQFAEEWREKVLPLRKEQGFRIPFAYTIEQTNQFAWLLSCDDDEDWDGKERAYYASAGRMTMEPDPARLISRAEEYFVEPAV